MPKNLFSPCALWLLANYNVMLLLLLMLTFWLPARSSILLDWPLTAVCACFVLSLAISRSRLAPPLCSAVRARSLSFCFSLGRSLVLSLSLVSSHACVRSFCARGVRTAVFATACLCVYECLNVSLRADCGGMLYASGAPSRRLIVFKLCQASCATVINAQKYDEWSPFLNDCSKINILYILLL